MSYPFANAELSSSDNRSADDDTPPQYVEMVDEVRALFSAPTEDGFSQGYEQLTQHQFAGSSAATSGTYFDSSNSMHRLAKQLFTSFEEDVSAANTHQSYML